MFHRTQMVWMLVTTWLSSLTSSFAASSLVRSVELAVENSRGRPVPEARVVLVGQERAGERREGQTDSRGRIAFQEVSVGRWQLQVRAAQAMVFHATLVLPNEGKAVLESAYHENQPQATTTLRVKVRADKARAGSLPLEPVPVRPEQEVAPPLAAVQPATSERSTPPAVATRPDPSPTPHSEPVGPSAVVAPSVTGTPSAGESNPPPSLPESTRIEETSQPVVPPPSPPAPSGATASEVPRSRGEVPTQVEASSSASATRDAAPPSQPEPPGLALAPTQELPRQDSHASMPKQSPTSGDSIQTLKVSQPTPGAVQDPVRRLPACSECRPGEVAFHAARIGEPGTPCEKPSEGWASGRGMEAVQCVQLEVELPRSFRYTGFRLRAGWAPDTLQDCFPARPCLGGAVRFPAPPVTMRSGDQFFVRVLAEHQAQRPIFLLLTVYGASSGP